MAILHAQPFFLLFVSLYFLPAALGAVIEFKNISHHLNSGLVNATKVEIIPYPIKYHDNPIFKITGVTSEDITGQGAFVNIRFYRYEIVYYRELPLCDVTKCPVTPGPITLTLADVYGPSRSDHDISGVLEVQLDITIWRGSGIPEYPMMIAFMFHPSALPRFTNGWRPNGVNVTKVEIFPSKVTIKDNPIFRIRAITPINISSSATVVATMRLRGGLLSDVSSRGYWLCDSTLQCPIRPGPFVLDIPHPYWLYKIKAGTYLLTIQIFDQLQERMYLIFELPISEAI